MFKTKTSIFIDSPLDKVFPYFAEIDRWPLWVDQLKQAYTHPPHIARKGGRYSQTMAWGKQAVVLEGTVTLYNPPEEVQFLAQGADLSVEGRYSFQSYSGGTYITYTESTKEKGLWMRLMNPFVRLIMKKRALQSFLTLKNICEGRSETLSRNHMSIFLLSLSFRYVVLLVSISFHQSIQAWVSACMGDSSAKDAGRLTFNPSQHYDFHGFVVSPCVAILYMFLGFPAEFFGWGRKLPFHQKACRYPQVAPFAIGGAGLLSYIGLICFFSNLPIILPHFIVLEDSFTVLIRELCQIFTNINVTLLFFNCIPFPRLDASLLVAPLLPKKWRASFLNLARFEMVFILAFCLAALGIFAALH